MDKTLDPLCTLQLSFTLIYVTLHGKTVNKVNARAWHVSTLKQKERDSTR